MMKASEKFLIVCFSTLVLSVSAEHVAAQSMIDLGTLGSTYSRAFGVSSDGSVIVGQSNPISDGYIGWVSDPLGGNGNAHAFALRGGRMVDLGTLGGTGSAATAVSANGQVIVGTSYLLGNSETRGFTYIGTTMTALPTLGGLINVANGVSSDGTVIVGVSSDIGGNCHAVKYVNSVLFDLGLGEATAVSANGSVIAGNSGSHAIIFTGLSMTDIGTLGGVFSQAWGLSADGSVIVGDSDTSGGDRHAFKYLGSAMTDLGTLGGAYSYARAVSANGSVIVGGSETAGAPVLQLGPSGYQLLPPRHAFKYVGTTMIDIGTLGGTSSQADGVSADGSVIVGSSNISGDTAVHAFAYTLGKMIDLPNTYTDLARSASNIRNTIALRSSSMALMMDYDCRAFAQYNTCISFGGRYGDLNASTNEGAGILTASYRVAPSMRIGAFIDHRVTQSKPAGIRYSDDTPSVGAFIGYDDHGDGTGAQGKLTAVYNTGKVGVTRLASSANTEAGSGRSALTSYAVGAELGWGIQLNDGWVGTAYAGIKLTSSKLGAYAEQLTDSVKFPISYADYGQRLTTATAGLRIDGRLTEGVSIALAAGIERDLRRTMDAYAGISDIPGLTSFSFSNSANSNRSRAVGSAALSYQIANNQRVSAGMSVRQNAYVSQPTRAMQMKYEMAF